MATKTRATPQKPPATPKSSKTKARPNGNIVAFFKKAEELSTALFVPDRFNESNGPVKKRKTEDIPEDIEELDQNQGGGACSPAPPEAEAKAEEITPAVEEAPKQSSAGKPRKRAGPFIDDSDSDDSEDNEPPPPLRHSFSEVSTKTDIVKIEGQAFAEPTTPEIGYTTDGTKNEQTKLSITAVSTLKREATSYSAVGDFEGFEDLEDDDFEDGEEFEYRRYMEEERKLGIYDDNDDFEGEFSLNQDVEVDDPPDVVEESEPTCPICSIALSGVTDGQASVHVNNCLDGNPTPLPVQQPVAVATSKTSARNLPLLKRPANPPQKNPFTMSISKSSVEVSAFTKLMSGHSEELAWKSAAAAEAKSRGKPAYERTCPFYKIIPGFSIAVDAFRYGAVEGSKAYFLSHFHSDHYIGLTSSWCHGPIYCSRVTGNLVRQQLRVDPKWVVDLEFEEEREIPGTDGARVTMISANHCPGSSLFLFEKALNKNKPEKMQRILHCGDFRACRAHIEHPLLRPDVQCKISGKTKEQKIDVCYLDTTYLNPKYAFPPQEEVISACSEMCVSLNSSAPSLTEPTETMKREQASKGMTDFLQGTSKIKNEAELALPGLDRRGRLLVIVGTYSIGKERICVGIAKALKSKIYAPAGKQRICKCLEDPELDALLTKDPREAQVHMTPLFEIRAETLDEYLNDYRDTFSRVVGFRPSGWNYRPPGSRFIDSPPVSTVLYGQNWKSNYTIKDLVPQRGSTKKASCFGVPYSEHSSFRELTMFCSALRVEKVIPTVNVGSAKSRERMKKWVERWLTERKKTGLFSVEAW
jgi:DNA cross-link repair 1A protein